MRSVSTICGFLLIIALTLPFSEAIDRKCGNNLQNLWLDVVILVDNSVEITENGILSVAIQTINVFGQGTKVGTTSTNDPRSTRVALVTYNANATIIGDLNTYQTANQLLSAALTQLQVSSVKDSYVDQGISAAAKVLAAGRANNYRSNYEQVVLIYAAGYRDDNNHDPLPAATRLKADGVSIITVWFGQTGNTITQDKLAKLASPGFAFANTDGDLTSRTQNALLGINCFCPSQWIHYRDDFYDDQSTKHGVCILPITLQAAWAPAKLSCHNIIKNAFLANEEDQHKHDFLLETIRNKTDAHPPYAYHIGLSFSNGKWSWEQPAGLPTIPVSDPNFWYPGFPTKTAADTGVLNQQVGDDVKVFWQNVNPYTVSKDYICEVSSCDTDNYCP